MVPVCRSGIGSLPTTARKSPFTGLVGAQAVRSSVVDQIGLLGGVDQCRPRRAIVRRDPDQAGSLVVVVVPPPAAPTAGRESRLILVDVKPGQARRESGARSARPPQPAQPGVESRRATLWQTMRGRRLDHLIRNDLRAPAESGGPQVTGVRRCPTLPHPGGCSTIGAGGLSFRVRNGSGRFPSAVTAVTCVELFGRGRWLSALVGRAPGAAQWTRGMWLW